MKLHSYHFTPFTFFQRQTRKLINVKGAGSCEDTMSKASDNCIGNILSETLRRQELS